MDDSGRLIGKVAVVTGGAKGLGRGISLAFARAGSDICVISRTASDLESVTREIRDFGRKAITYCGDISREAEVTGFVEKVVGEFGHVDFLVNNAGAFLERKIGETTLEDWNGIIATNLTGTFIVTKAVVEQMKKQRSGHVFTISSVGGRVGLSGKSAYCAAKFGVTGFCKALAKELKEFGIKMQIVYPYYVDSYGEIDWSKEGREQLRAVSVEDVADMIVYHASLPLRVLTEDIVFDPYLR